MVARRVRRRGVVRPTLASAIVIAIVSIVAPRPSAAVVPQGTTAFTYQGRLTDAGPAASGIYDFQFALYDVDVGGSQVGTNVSVDDVTVTNGLFTVSLDFGAVFTGGRRWLEVRVRPGASLGTYTVLSPREELTPSPLALFSAAAPWTGISGKPVGFSDDVDNDTLGGLSCASGEVAKSDGVSWTCGSAPTANQEAALAGTSGSPSVFNPYVTDADPRNSNARVPSVHGSGLHDATVASRDGGGLVPTAQMGTGSASSATLLRGDRTWQSIAQVKPMVVTANTGATTAIGVACTHYLGGDVTITVAVAGTVVVRAQAWIKLNHVVGTRDEVQLAIGTASNDCSGTGNSYSGRAAIASEMPTMATQQDVTLSIANVFPVTAGSYTYYLNGIMNFGADANDVFWFGNLQAEFFPN
jgi:hypothetical protein